MKKTLIALTAVLTLSGLALAQDAVKTETTQTSTTAAQPAKPQERVHSTNSAIGDNMEINADTTGERTKLKTSNSRVNRRAAAPGTGVKTPRKPTTQVAPAAPSEGTANSTTTTTTTTTAPAAVK